MEKTVQEKVPTVCSQRWILAYISCAGFFFLYALRVNMSVAIVCMVKSSDNSSSAASQLANFTSNGQCKELDDQNVENYEGEFDWNKSVQSSILASFFYGYIVTQIPGGWLADRFGGWRVFGTAMAINAFSTLLIPVCTRTSIILLYVLRVLLGLASGVVFPACYSMLGRWAPPMERTILTVISSVGSIIGVVGTFSTSGVLCEYGFDNGWGSIFYITGGLCCVWVVIWFTQVRDYPAQHPRITHAERDYIVNNIEFDTSKRTRKIPWTQMLKSLPLWAIFICHMCGNWAEFTLLTSLPGFMKSVLKYDIKRNGVLSSLPYICYAVMGVLLGYIGDAVRKRGVLTTTQTRKIFQLIGNISAGVFLVATGFVTCKTREIAVVFLCLAVLSASFCNAGYSANYIDLAPQYAGILFGLSNTLATIPGMIAPIVAGALTPNDTPEEWRNVFYIGAAFYLFGGLFYVIFASGHPQPWGVDQLKDVVVKSEPLPKKREKMDDGSLIIEFKEFVLLHLEMAKLLSPYYKYIVKKDYIF